MLRLREIEISGFKSFADRTRMPLPGELLMVVGPNGSGKSNVADAILWALGEQSARSLRGRKMQDVIFGGTHKRPASGSAEVVLSFQDGDGSKAALGRRLLRSGESAYLMEGRPVRLKDVHEFMMRYAISTQGTFLVEQGRVDELIAANPEDLRLVFEEVAGIAHYKENRKSALQKLDAAQQNLLRLSDVIAEVAVQMGTLKRQAAKAERFVKLSDELRTRRRRFWGRQFAQLTAQRTSVSRDLELLRSERERRASILSQRQAELEGARQRLAEHETALQGLIGAIHDKELQAERAEQENRRRTDQVLAGKQRLRQIGADREELQGRSAAALKEREAMAEEVARLEAAEAQAESAAESAREALEEARRAVEALEASQEGLRRKTFASAQEHARLSANLGRLEEDLRKQAERERRLERETQALAERSSGLSATLDDLEGRKSEAEESLAVARRERSLAEETHASLVRGLEEAQARLAEARRVTAASESALESLLEHESALRSSAHAYLAEAAPGRAGRILARILGSVPEALVPPLTAALGELLEGYLDGGDAGLEDLLAGLREAKAGQAVFFVDRPKDRPRRPLPEGSLGWLHEAEGLPAEARDLMPDVVLVPTAGEALAAARASGVPAASMDGAFAHPDGWVRGGEGGRGAAAVLDSERRRKELETRHRLALADVGASETAAAKARESLDAAVRDVASRREEEAAQAEGLQVLLREWERADAERGRLEASASLLETEVEQAREEREAWESQRKEAQAALEACAAARRTAEEELAEGEAALQAGRLKRESAHEAVAESRARQGEASERHKASREALATAEGYLAQLEATGGRLAEEASALEVKLDGLAKAITQGDQEIRDLLLSLEESRERKTRFESDLSRLQEEVRVHDGRVREAAETLEDSKTELGAMELTMAGLESDLRNLVERIGETFEEAPEELAASCAGEPPLSPEERQEEFKALGRLEGRIDELGGVNMLAREEYAELEKRHGFLTGQKEDVETSVASLQETIRKINRTTRERFMEAFTSVQEHFARLFREVFEGGEARLSLVDDANPLESGVEIYAQPPGKKLQHLQLLSGGEKAMTALALLFSLFRYRPQPFFILDEVDASLDEANIGRFNRLLERFRTQTQFVVVTHNKRTMEMADILYGVTMVEAGVSRIVSVRMADIEEPRPAGP